MKTCTKCGNTKPFSEFHRDRRARDGRRADCKACLLRRNREHYEANREARLARRKVQHEANRGEENARMRVYDGAHREEKRARMQAYRETRREDAAARTRLWRKANPARCRVYKLKRRARQLALPRESIDPRLVYLRDLGVCGICGGITDSADWHLDHIIPLARGGSHTYGNVQVAHPLCNMSKGAREEVQIAA